MALSQVLESQLQLLREALTSERSSGEVRFSVTALGEEETDLEALDARATQQEFRPMADSWRPLSRAEVEALLGRVLHLDLAYGGAALAAERAQELAARFCDLFGPEGGFFSNAEATALTHSNWTWTPLTWATLDVGLGQAGRGSWGSSS